MKKYCEKMDFRNHLNIFISSAMSDENGFAWRDLRKNIKTRLNECPLLNAFTIEDQCDPMPSMQYFKSQVTRTDVVVLLLKSTARPGTCMEFDIVKKKHKKLFPYFIKSDDVDLSVCEIKNELQKLDYCTYFEYDPKSNDNLEDIIYKHIMSSLVNWYRSKDISINDMQDTTQEYTLTNITEYNNSLPKSILKNFDSCYGETFNILDIRKHKSKIKDKSKLHDVGVAMLDWLLTNNDFPTNDKILQIISTMKDIFSDITWLSKRWEACKSMAKNDLDQALKYENEALTLAENGTLPSWLITDILIDCRNISNSNSPFSGQKYQNKFSATKELIYFPGLDRFCSNLFNDVIDEHQKELIKSFEEMTFGNNLSKIVTEFENCLFISMLYGSYTHIILAREALAKVLYQYGNIYNDENLIFISTKLHILCGDAKKLEKIIDHDWETIGNDLIANADYLLDLAMKLSDCNIILIIIKKFIVYFNDESIKIATDYLMDLSLKIEWHMGDIFVKAINFASGIMCSEDVVKILTSLLRRNIIQKYSVFTSTLIHLDISKVNDDILNEFCNVLKENAAKIVENNGNPQYIAALINQKEDIFGSLKDVPDNGLVNDELVLFEINTNSSYHVEKWQDVLRTQIKDIEHQMNINSHKGFYSEFTTHPFMTVKSFVESSHCKFNDIKEIIDKELVPLCIQILKNYIAISLTDECIECLISIVAKCKKNQIDIPQKLIDFLNGEMNSKEDTDREIQYTISPFHGNLTYSIRYRYLMLKTICMIDVREEMYSNYLNFSDEGEKERIAISECLKEYFDINSNSVSDPILISLAFLLSNNISHKVRENACYCMYSLTLNQEYSNYSYLKLRELSTDAHPNVRNKLLNIYQNDNRAQKDEKYKDIVSNLTKDAHYIIRHKAQELLS